MAPSLTGLMWAQGLAGGSVVESAVEWAVGLVVGSVVESAAGLVAVW